MKKVLICGARGFIGRNLFDALSRRPDLDVYGTYLSDTTLKNHRLQRADLTDRVLSKTVTKSVDVVINCAAVTDGALAVTSNPGKYIADNVRINTNLAESVYENGVPHFIFLSCSVLYPANNTIPVKESDVNLSLIHPAYHTGARMKLFSEDLCNFFSKLGKTRFTIVRHSNNYGPFDKFDEFKGHVFSATVEKIMSSRNNVVVVRGQGHEKKDFLHVYDLVNFIELAIRYEMPGSQVFNVGSGRSLSIRELVAKINSISGKNLPVHYDLSKSTIDTNIILDIEKAGKVLGWKPKIDIEEGIRQTIDWYLKTRGGNER